MATAELVIRARAGDGDAFRALVEPHHRELLVHCYRMLGAYQDAEDVLQETLLAAWHGFGGFEGRASLRTWLYRIATNRCLNARRAATRRPAKAWDIPGAVPPEPTGLGEVTWLEPFPDGPEARYERAESISLAFVTALQLLPPRQLAVLILRDVLDFPATDVATMLATTTDSVKSALKRARTTLEARRPPQDPPPAQNSPTEKAITTRFARAWEDADLTALVELLTDDAFMSMPPLPHEYEGKDLIIRFCERLFHSGRRFVLVPTRANGQPAFGAYLRTATGPQAAGLYVLTLSGHHIQALTRFEATTLRTFGLPDTLPHS